MTVEHEKPIVARWIDERLVVFLGDKAIPLNVECVEDGDGSGTETGLLTVYFEETPAEEIMCRVEGNAETEVRFRVSAQGGNGRADYCVRERREFAERVEQFANSTAAA